MRHLQCPFHSCRAQGRMAVVLCPNAELCSQVLSVVNALKGDDDRPLLRTYQVRSAFVRPLLRTYQVHSVFGFWELPLPASSPPQSLHKPTRVRELSVELSGMVNTSSAVCKFLGVCLCAPACIPSHCRFRAPLRLLLMRPTLWQPRLGPS